MLMFTSSTDPRLSSLPPPIRSVIIRQILILCALCQGKPDAEQDGFVGYVEPQDTPQTVEIGIGRPLERIEGVFIEGGSLVAVILWGNAGAGISLVYPQAEGHAPAVAEKLRQLLSTSEVIHEEQS